MSEEKRSMGTKAVSDVRKPRLRHYQVVSAVFDPIRTDDLREGAHAWIGRRHLWQVAWRITKEDGGPYVGCWALIHHGERPPGLTGFGWVPDCDLRDFQEVENAKRP